MASVIGVVIALLVMFVLTAIVLLIAYKKQKLCFKVSDPESSEKTSKDSIYSTYNSSDVKEYTLTKEKQSIIPPSTKV
jgi:mannitol-specific phosphotransferase system IIBC component